MATIKAIEGRSVHQIQSGQVIVDLISVVKELVENSLDAGATSIDIRFKNHGLDSIEVQDNGTGIAPQDFETIALKHYTSKLSAFEDLDHLDTFGFRGEALSSLSALSALRIVTARAQDGAVGKRLDFEQSGKLKNTSVIAAQKGTTVVIEELFHPLPVRRKELQKNIKREYGKALSFLYSYACIGVGVRFTVSNQMPKGKKTLAFSTKGNLTTKENIANIFGAKTLTALVKVDLKLNMQPASGASTQSAGNWSSQPTDQTRPIHVEGYISKPSWGEGRQTPDRQMLFVNSRPCNLPQVSKVFNEVYKSFNHHQSPFILGNFQMNTASYDVNVSPDKKTIMLHDQTALLEALKAELVLLFENIDHTLPQSQLAAPRLPSYKPLPVSRRASEGSGDDGGKLIQNWASDDNTQRCDEPATKLKNAVHTIDRQSSTLPPDENLEVEAEENYQADDISRIEDDVNDHKLLRANEAVSIRRAIASPAEDTTLIDTENARQAQQIAETASTVPVLSSQLEVATISTSIHKSTSEPVADAFSRMRSRRISPESAEITTEERFCSPFPLQPWSKRRKLNIINRPAADGTQSADSSSATSPLTQFAAPGSQLLLNFGKGHSQATGVNQDEPEAAAFANGDGTPVLLSSGDFDDDDNDADRKSLIDPESPTPAEEEHSHDEIEKIGSLIDEAERSAAQNTSSKRGILSTQPFTSRKDITYNLTTSLATSIDQMKQHSALLGQHVAKPTPLDGEPFDQDMDPESKLSLTVHKTDFDQMNVVGQFNLGFILATRGNPTTHDLEDLFIIDQHAADEKYNYERFQSTLVLQSQPLVRPVDLELTAAEEEVVLSHLDAIKANGFEIEVIDDAVSSSRNFRLLALPTANHKTFKLSDLEELLYLLSEMPSGGKEIPRPRKVQQMLAMRACRSSIMVGKTLTSAQMLKVVRHMGTMDSPWNCPHSRPTMRHLFKLNSLQTWHEYDDSEVNLSPNNIWQQWLDQQT